MQDNYFNYRYEFWFLDANFKLGLTVILSISENHGTFLLF